MSNIQNLLVIQGEDGVFLSKQGVPTDFDLSALNGTIEVPKQVSGVYIKIVSNTVVEKPTSSGGAIFATKVTNPVTNAVAYIKNSVGEVTPLLASDCAACSEDSKPSQAVEIQSSCAKPVYVEICNTTPGANQQLLFTDASEICVDNSGTKEGWLVRERIVWDITSFVVVSRVTEYSKDGTTWSETAPTGTISIGACQTPILDADYELIYTQTVSICTPDCIQWFTRNKIIWDSKLAVEVSNVQEFSQDNVTWSEVGPDSYSIGKCSPAYDVVEHYIVNDATGPFTIPADTVHSISYKVLSGTVDISIDGVVLPYSKGEFDAEEATTTLAVEYVFTPKPKSCIKVKIITQRLCS